MREEQDFTDVFCFVFLLFFLQDVRQNYLFKSLSADAVLGLIVLQICICDFC